MPDAKTDQFADVSNMVEPIKTPVRVDRLDGAFPKRGYFLVDAKGIAWFEDTRKAVLDQIALSLNRGGMAEGLAEAARDAVNAKIHGNIRLMGFGPVRDALEAALAAYDALGEEPSHD